MFNITWGEIIVVSSVGLYFVGKKDLPKISRIVGVNIGRIVGFIHGLRTNAATAATSNTITNKKELQQLQYQLQTNIRQIQLLKNEIQSSFNPSLMSNNNSNNMSNNNNNNMNMVTTTQAALTSGINSDNNTSTTSGAATSTAAPVIPPLHSYYNNTNNNHIDNNNNNNNNIIPAFPIPSPTQSTTQSASSSGFLNSNNTTTNNSVPYLSSLSSNSNLTIHNKQSLRAIAEDEWQRHGIGFTSRAEGQTQFGQNQQNQNQNQQNIQGSFLVADIIKQSLINDEQDRIVNESYNLLYK